MSSTEVHMLAYPSVHRDGGRRGSVDASGGTELADLDHSIRCLDRFGRQPRALLPEQQHTLLRKVESLNDDAAGNVVDGNDRHGALFGPGDEVGDIRMVQHVLVAIGHHGAALVPATATDD